MLIPSPTIGVEELHADKDGMYLLDVRNEQEWNAGHIEGAHHIELTKFPKVLNQIQTQKPIAVICHSGNRASIIASLLEREQKSRVFNVKGGMQSWVRAKFPVTSIN
jgi:hydroxyacylglutathione hydrolase